MRFAVIGLGNFGSHLAQTLAKSGAEVLAIDKDLVLIEQFKHEVTRAVSLDTTVQNNLKMASLTDMDAVIVTIGEHSVEASIMTTALIAGLGVEWLIARSTSSLHGRILKLVGAHEVINPEQFVAQKLVRRITQPNVLELAAISDDGYSMSDITAPPSFYGKTLAELELRKKYGLISDELRSMLQAQKEMGKLMRRKENELKRERDAEMKKADVQIVSRTFDGGQSSA